MRKAKLDDYRAQLRDLARRLQGTAADLEESARVQTGGPAGGNLSNAPMHLGDLGTAVFTQELNAALLENEEYLRGEVNAALDRLDAGTFGSCEGCGRSVPTARLDILPYARYCVACAEKLETGEVNLNRGRPQDRSGVVNPIAEPPEPEEPDDSGDAPPLTRLAPPRAAAPDVHAAGTPGGGSAVGGLAGTNIGGGAPTAADLADAMGSGTFDADLADGDPQAYAGPSGGAVGGTPANKRAVGGKRRRGPARQS
jgi:RNA polymerase-binding transcription factor DksA